MIEKRRLIRLLIVLLCVFTGTIGYSQNDFLVYGKVRLEDRSDLISIVVKTKEKVVLEKKTELSGAYELFLDYGENYTITYSFPGYVPLIFTLYLDLPEGVKECCFTPMNLTFHLFKPNIKDDHLFKKPLCELKYDEIYKNFNYDIDVDYKVHRMLIDAEIERKKAITDSIQLAAIKDSLKLEEQYMELINRGNLLYAANHFEESKLYFQKALDLKPKRRYPKYKIEDIHAEMTYMDKQADSLGISLDSLLPQKENIDTVQEKPIVYKRMTEEELNQQFLKDLYRNIEKQAGSKAELNEMLEYASEKVDKNIANPELALVKEEPIIVDTASEEPIEERSVLVEEIPEPVSENIEPEIVKEPLKVFVPDIPTSVTDTVFDYQEYQDSLAQKYPDTKTVEIEEDFYKKVTRIIINKDKIVTIYLKVEHNWGATFYFIDRTPFDPENISSSYFYHATTLESDHATD